MNACKWGLVAVGGICALSCILILGFTHDLRRINPVISWFQSIVFGLTLWIILLPMFGISWLLDRKKKKQIKEDAENGTCKV